LRQLRGNNGAMLQQFGNSNVSKPEGRPPPYFGASTISI
jgi:hypothetical protein